ncbi:MAG: HNH endonuclease signature motif containing protein [Acidobacteriota bacterium]
MSRQKEAVRSRAHGICEYCVSQESFATQSFSVDHIIPPQAGGGDGEDNLAFACQGCNNHKYTRIEALDPVTDEVVRHPDRRSHAERPGHRPGAAAQPDGPRQSPAGSLPVRRAPSRASGYPRRVACGHLLPVIGSFSPRPGTLMPVRGIPDRAVPRNEPCKEES